MISIALVVSAGILSINYTRKSEKGTSFFYLGILYIVFVSCLQPDSLTMYFNRFINAYNAGALAFVIRLIPLIFLILEGLNRRKEYRINTSLSNNTQ